jgi:hypothetical protein
MIGRIFKKLTQKEELKTNEGEDFVIEVEGKDISIRDLLAQNKNLASQVEELKLNKKNEEDKKEKEEEEDDKKENADDKSVDIDGEEIKMSSLKEMYRSSKKKNAEDSGEDKKEEKKENSKEDEEAQKNFKMVKELHENGVTYNLETEFLSTREKVQLGKKRYGSR